MEVKEGEGGGKAGGRAVEEVVLVQRNRGVQSLALCLENC